MRNASLTATFTSAARWGSRRLWGRRRSETIPFVTWVIYSIHRAKRCTIPPPPSSRWSMTPSNAENTEVIQNNVVIRGCFRIYGLALGSKYLIMWLWNYVLWLLSCKCWSILSLPMPLDIKAVQQSLHTLVGFQFFQTSQIIKFQEHYFSLYFTFYVETHQQFWPEGFCWVKTVFPHKKKM